MTETGMYAVNPPSGRKKSGSIGLPYYGVQLSIIDSKGRDVCWGESGEIAIKSPFAMDGYSNDTAATRRVMRDGWIRTGDFGRIDYDGYIWMEGQKKTSSFTKEATSLRLLSKRSCRGTPRSARRVLWASKTPIPVR